MRIVNLEKGMPTVEEARKRLLEALQQAQQDKQRALKVVHGYGSSGAGGKLRDAIRKSLNLRRKEGKIVGFCPGEQWGPFDATAQALLEKMPELKRDSDYGKGNYGVSVVLLK